MVILRNIFRKKLRAILTISGITIGVFALVVMGSLAEKMTLLVEGGTKYYKDKISVSEGSYASSLFSVGLIPIEKISEIEKVEGVDIVSVSASTTLSDELGAVNFGTPAMISGSDRKGAAIDEKTFKINFQEGRDLTNDDKGKAVVGSDLVKKLNAKVGEKITIKNTEFEVVGILEKTLTIPDTGVSVPFSDVQAIVYKSLPDLIKNSVKENEIINSITVYVKEGYNPDEIATKIEEQVKGITATGPKKFEEQVTSQIAIFSAIIFGVALISLLVGGLSVMNTMTMSISERIREIGIRKAIGGSEGRIIRQFLAESAIMSMFGGAIGLFLGWIFVSVANSIGNQSGTTLFLLTPRLAIGSIVFAFILGVLSGLIPAWRAARMNPVEALRYE